MGTYTLKEVKINVKLRGFRKAFCFISMLRFYSWFIGIDRALQKLGKTIDIHVVTSSDYE